MSDDNPEQALINAVLKWASAINPQSQHKLQEAVKEYKATKKDADRQSVLDSLSPTVILDTLNRTYETFKRNLDKPEAIEAYKAFDAAAFAAYSLLRGPETRRVARPSSDDDNPGQDTFAFFNVQNKLRRLFRLSYLADLDEDHRELLSAAQALYEFALRSGLPSVNEWKARNPG